MPTLKDAFDGLSYATGTVTLATGTTTTTVNRMGVSKTSHIDLEPTNAAAATEWATTRPFVSSKARALSSSRTRTPRPRGRSPTHLEIPGANQNGSLRQDHQHDCKQHHAI
jgi:hypothetical protein